ncbi:hypothetical protein [Kibdelosporangium aridum]|uniref:hypothetical protein n=1 Tax=Kibdelosporangium aridum TaxID=2030 RepID=UPI00052501E6
MTELLLACSTVDVTPPPGHPMAGYVARGDAPAVGTLDPLEATVFWLSTEDDPGVFWLSLDALAVDTELAGKLSDAVGRATGIPSDRVLVCASHTHAAPRGWTGRLHPAMSGDRDQALVDSLVDSVIDGVAGLPEQRVPVDLSWCVASVKGLGSNRNRKDGLHDTSAGVVTARPRDATSPARTAALLVDYACHPTVLGPRSQVWSADWPGSARRSLAAALAAVDDPRTSDPAQPVVAFLQGAAGDSSPRFVRRGRDYAEVARLGALLGGAVLQAIQVDATAMAPAKPTMHKKIVQVPTREVPLPEVRDQLVTDAKEKLAGPEDTPEERLHRTRLEGALALFGLGTVELPAHLDLPLTVVALGDLAWVHLPVELFASFGFRIKQASPFPVTRVIGYTDGYAGYVSDAEGYREGCFEALMSLVDECAGEILVKESVALLEKARQEG